MNQILKIRKTINDLGLIYRDTGEKEKSYAMFSDTLEISKKHFGDTHSTVADSLNYIGSLYSDFSNNTEISNMKSRKLMNSEHRNLITRQLILKKIPKIIIFLQLKKMGKGS